jgi:hypothetical protein
LNELAFKLLGRDLVTVDSSRIPGLDVGISETYAQQRLRALFGLNRTDSAMFFRIAVRLVDAYPHLLRLVGEDLRTYEGFLRDYKRVDVPEGLTFTDDADGRAATISRAADEWLPDPVIEITPGSAETLVSVGGRSTTVTTTKPADTFYPEWPSWSGIVGGVTGTEGVTYHVTHTPIRVNLVKLRDRLLGHSAAHVLVQESPNVDILHRAVYLSRDPAETAAAVLVALCDSVELADV